MSLVSNEQKSALAVLAEIFGDVPLYLVGGWVRDTFLGRASDDIDLTSPAQPADVLENTRRFANRANKMLSGWRVTFFPLDTERGTARVLFTASDDSDHFYFDINAFEGGDLTTDLQRRDFSVNGLAVPLKLFLANAANLTDDMLIDVVGGLADLKARQVRPIAEANIIADPVRMLRGVRLRATLSRADSEWTLAPDTLGLFARHAAMIEKTAAERCREELNKILLASDVERSLRYLDEAKLLTRLIPELEEGRGCVQMQAHYYDVFDHSLKAVECQEWMLRPVNFRGESLDVFNQMERPEKIVREWPEMLQLFRQNQRERELGLMWGTLLHDVGKPRAKTVDPLSGKIRFYNHQHIGADMAREVMARLRFGTHLTERVATMVRHHLRIGQISEAGEPPTRRAIYRFFRDTAPVEMEMLPLSLADHAAVVGPEMVTARQLKGWLHHLEITDFLAHHFLGPDEERVVNKPRLLDGRTLMQTFKLPPSPEVGRILKAVEEAHAVGEITTTEEALALAQTLIPNQTNPKAR